MPKMLKHTVTGELYPMNADMLRHPDMEIFDTPDPQFKAAAKVQAAPAVKKAPVKKFLKQKKVAPKSDAIDLSDIDLPDA